MNPSAAWLLGAVVAVLASVLLLSLCFALRAKWPRRLRDYGHIAVAGLLMQSIYLVGVYYGIFLGASTGIMALIVGLQPLITGALVGPFLGESVSRRQWLGLGLGFGGLSLVVAEDRFRRGGLVRLCACADGACGHHGRHALPEEVLHRLRSARYGGHPERGQLCLDARACVSV